VAHGFWVNSDTPEIVAWNLSRRCRTGEALPAVGQALLERLPAGSHETGLTLPMDNRTQFTSTRFLETLATAPWPIYRITIDSAWYLPSPDIALPPVCIS